MTKQARKNGIVAKGRKIICLIIINIKYSHPG